MLHLAGKDNDNVQLQLVTDLTHGGFALYKKGFHDGKHHVAIR